MCKCDIMFVGSLKIKSHFLFVLSASAEGKSAAASAGQLHPDSGGGQTTASVS